MHNRHPLPPLNALRAFESAARHLSFTNSARELGVTQTAVSHQIKALEAHLRCRLFERKTRSLLLTDAGRTLSVAASRAFADVEEAAQRITSGEVRRALTVSVLPSLASRWLLPRLKRFRVAHPEIELHLVPSTELADVTRGEADIGIRWGRGHYAGLSVHRLMGDELYPVCVPELLRGSKRPRAPRELLRQLLLHDENDDENDDDWVEWFAAAGVNDVNRTRDIFFTDASLLIQAAVDGLGVGLARRVLVAEELRRGRLMRPFPLSIPAKFSYYLVCQPSRADEPKLRAFRDWVIGEVGRENVGSKPR